MATKEQALKALERYANAVQAIKDHIEDNPGVFKTHDSLVGVQIDADNNLRDIVSELGEGVTDGQYNVIVRNVNYETVDIGELDKLVDSGVLSKEVRNRLVKMTNRPAQITISQVRG